MLAHHPTAPWVSVVIPIKDERDNLIPLTEQLLGFLRDQEKSRTQPFEIVYIDDGSSDGSGELLNELAKNHSEVQVLHFDRNYGQTSAFVAGFRQAKGEWFITLDGDLQFDPADIARLLPLTHQYDLICGWRKGRKDSPVKKISSRLAFLLRRLVVGDPIHDAGCSLKILRPEVVAAIPCFEGMHRFIPALARLQGFKVTEVPVRHLPRVHGVSKYGVGNRAFKVMFDLMALRWMKKRLIKYQIKKT